jgi:hypothetical protein
MTLEELRLRQEAGAFLHGIVPRFSHDRHGLPMEIDRYHISRHSSIAP